MEYTVKVPEWTPQQVVMVDHLDRMYHLLDEERAKWMDGKTLSQITKLRGTIFGMKVAMEYPPTKPKIEHLLAEYGTLSKMLLVFRNKPGSDPDAIAKTATRKQEFKERMTTFLRSL
jgi:hypothetical protein